MGTTSAANYNNINNNNNMNVTGSMNNSNKELLMFLGVTPAAIVVALAALLNLFIFLFLQHHILDSRDHFAVFFMGSYCVFSSYYTIYYFFERFSTSFRKISSQEKKFYIISNLIKAGVLIAITPFAVRNLIKAIFYDEWETNILQNLGCIYAIPDFISMIVVKRMRWSTWLHHLCVVVFNYFSIMNDYRRENVCRCLVVYAGFSTLPYCVNLLLASRFLGFSNNNIFISRFFSYVSLVIYTLSIAINWCWQCYYLRHLLFFSSNYYDAKSNTRSVHWTVYVYMLFISFVMWDDIILNKWLLTHARSNYNMNKRH